jgi:hypothetical protein
VPIGRLTNGCNVQNKWNSCSFPALVAYNPTAPNLRQQSGTIIVQVRIYTMILSAIPTLIGLRSSVAASRLSSVNGVSSVA